jgi:formimidoylglutamate deiminase
VPLKIEQERIVFPGLVNAHSHSFQRILRGRTERRSPASRRRQGSEDSFWTWRDAMYRAANELSPEEIYHVSRMAFLEMLLAGITTVGEFHYLHSAPDGSRYPNPNLLARQVVRAAQDTGIRIVLLRTAYVRPGWQTAPNPLQARFITPHAKTFIADTEVLRAELPDVPIGIAPHSIRAVPIEYLLEIVSYARANQLPIHMHVAEQPAEIEASIAEYSLRPLELLEKHGLLDASFTAVHAIHITRDEISMLARSGASVCACPTTERNLGDGPVPADRLRDAAVPICFGSDSNVQIDLLEDARSLEYHLRMSQLQRAVLTPEFLLTGLTQAGLRALGLPDQPGDWFTLDLNDPSLAGADCDRQSLLPAILFAAGRGAIRDVFVNGQRIVDNGRHASQDEIIREFRSVCARLP